MFAAVFLCGMMELSYNTESEDDELDFLNSMAASLLGCHALGVFQLFCFSGHSGWEPPVMAENDTVCFR